MIREEPAFGSMIWCDDLGGRVSRPISRRASVLSLNPYLNNKRYSIEEPRKLSFGATSNAANNETLDEVVDLGEVYADLDPVSFYKIK